MAPVGRRCRWRGALLQVCDAWCLVFPTCYVSGQKKTTRTRHTTHPPAVPMVEGDAEGGGGGDLANGPLDGRRNRGLNPRRRRLPVHGTYY